ncbi:MAG: YggU family protein [Actinobacteria bacterium]|mgnify:CR=1 FL=1|nr:MAG: YggU family protein [Actinomycetota bacterium]REK38411.1 MAG: YggU family protein [Actinomycetota bacterium]
MRDDQGPVRPAVDGVELRIWVVTGASKDEIVGIHGDRVKVRVAAAAESGRANAAVCDLLSGVIGAPVRIVSGHRSRRKLVLAEGVDVEAVRGNLGR